MENLPKKVVLITGCSSGIGLETAVTLAQHQNFVVYATMRDLTKCVALESTLKKTKFLGNIKIRRLDVTNEDTIVTVISEIIEEEGQIDVLINNAGIALAGFCETVMVEQVQRIFDINFLGVVRMFQRVLPTMRAQKRGHIITISSVSAISAPTGLGFYASTKAALESLHQAEAPILAQWNIKLTILQAGTILTNQPHMAEKVELGTRENYKKHGEEDIYGKQLAGKKKDYIDYVHYAGAPVSEVAEKISKIIFHPEVVAPVIQTKGEAKKMARDHYVDPKGGGRFSMELEQTRGYLDVKT